MKKFLLIYNPMAGDAYFKYRLDELIEQFQRRDSLVTPVKMTRREDTGRFVRWADEVGADGIIVSGGDGTIHSIVNAMLNQNIDVPLGIIPSGTSNDFASFLNLSQDLGECADLITSGAVQMIDVGLVNDQYFINVASGGLLTSAAHSADPVLKNTLGKVAYYLKGIEELPNFRALRMKITADGVCIDGEVVLFIIANSATVGSFRNLAPRAKINDGKLDLFIVNNCRLPELMRLFISLLTGNHTSHKNVRYLQAREICIECAEELVSDLDGELGPRLPLKITAVANKLKVFCSI